MEQILVVDDDKDICLLLHKFLTKHQFGVHTENRGQLAVEYLKHNPVDLVLLDFKLPDYTGIEILQKIKIISPHTQVIIITGYSDMRTAVESLKKGAYDYVTKPLYPDEILLSVKNALKDGQSKKSRKDTSEQPDTNVDGETFIMGKSPQSQAVQKHIELIAPTDMSVIILGDTGTGKEYVARAIHQQSHRHNKPFVAVDCGALPVNLVSSELFGHVKGAFTGAVSDKKGCFEQADGGTLFLDEIGNLSYENQTYLLRVLQDKKVKKVGGTKSTKVDVRLLVATNDDLKKQVIAGEFREDIYHRLNEFMIELTPLRNRPEDIELFALEFLKQANAQLNKQVQGFADDAMMVLKRYQWYGNFRELRNVVKRSVLLCNSKQIKKDNLPLEIIRPSRDEICAVNVSMEGGVKDLKTITELAEKQAIEEVLRQTNNNKTKTAELLGVDRKTLYNKISAYNIDIDSF